MESAGDALGPIDQIEVAHGATFVD
jgi:hypothetical protein